MGRGSTGALQGSGICGQDDPLPESLRSGCSLVTARVTPAAVRETGLDTLSDLRPRPRAAAARAGPGPGWRSWLQAVALGRGFLVKGCNDACPAHPEKENVRWREAGSHCRYEHRCSRDLDSLAANYDSLIPRCANRQATQSSLWRAYNEANGFIGLLGRLNSSM